MSNSDSHIRSNPLQSEFASAEMSLHAIYMHEVISYTTCCSLYYYHEIISNLLFYVPRVFKSYSIKSQIMINFPVEVKDLLLLLQG